MVETRKIDDKESMVKLCAVQMEPRIGYKEENVKKSLELIRKAAEEGANIIVLPEMANTGYMFNTREEAYEVAERIPDGETTKAWMEIAKELDVYIVAGIGELDDDGIRMYNSAVFVGPEGYIGKHRKLHHWNYDKTIYEPGDLGFQIFHTKYGRIGILICYDIWFWEDFRLLARKGADLVCVPTNWCFESEHLDTLGPHLCMCNAETNNIFICAADRVGVERDQYFPGKSCITGPGGYFRAGPASTDKEELVMAEVNLIEGRSITNGPRNAKLMDRRTDLFDDALGSGEQLMRL